MYFNIENLDGFILIAKGEINANEFSFFSCNKILLLRLFLVTLMEAQ